MSVDIKLMYRGTSSWGTLSTQTQAIAHAQDPLPAGLLASAFRGPRPSRSAFPGTEDDPSAEARACISVQQSFFFHEAARQNQ
jgi:hypothetical protein